MNITLLQALPRLSVQIKHLKKGIKETGIWPPITSGPDVVPLLFPRETELMVLQSIIWPQVRETDERTAMTWNQKVSRCQGSSVSLLKAVCGS
ncbi:hypothetical protein XENORESO_010831 [Xenotaenia resolanae]|uniref:Uncharacterized protein n=1 Tax=Xenotaenia resolanae TaxID=208358 RepID=A0ABV0VZ10_9TELE